MGIVDRLKDRLQVQQSEETSARFQNVESFFGRTVGQSSFSWGLIVLSAFGIYGVVNLVLVILRFF